MKTLTATTLAVALALSALSPALAEDKKCEAGMEWDKTTQQCVEKKS